jgi:hypothetical protein
VVAPAKLAAGPTGPEIDPDSSTSTADLPPQRERPAVSVFEVIRIHKTDSQTDDFRQKRVFPDQAVARFDVPGISIIAKLGTRSSRLSRQKPQRKSVSARFQSSKAEKLAFFRNKAVFFPKSDLRNLDSKSVAYSFRVAA